MRLLLTLLLLLCFSVTYSVAQQRTTTPKTTTPARKPAPAARRPAPAPRPPVVAPPAETTLSQPASLTFPSTDADTEPMDPVKKQQMYDELHGVKALPAQSQGRKAEMARRSSARVSPAGAEAGAFIGVRAGGNYTMFLESLPVTTTIYGFHVGVVGLFGRGGVAFQPEINYVQDYSQFSSSGVSVSETNSAIVVPLLAKFQFGQQGSPRFFVNVGPYGAYAINNASDGVVDYGGALGLGVGIPLRSDAKLTVEARGYYGLGSTARGSEFGNVPGKPLQAQLSVGYLFPLGSR